MNEPANYRFEVRDGPHSPRVVYYRNVSCLQVLYL
jgi:hypothetical protein